MSEQQTKCKDRLHFKPLLLMVLIVLPQSAMAGPPVTEVSVPLAYSLEAFAENAVSGGVPKDGIPPIDEPVFIDKEEANGFLREDDIVLGVVINGQAKAYPRQVLAWHEIVNDELAGRPISVTYCPLTGTALGFERGDTTFGVSGSLVNSNLIMYDRETDSRWPQMLGMAVSGSFKGKRLQEVRVFWTTWKRWQTAYPETRVLSQHTGYARDYTRDPYGGYNPVTGYYAKRGPVFPTMNQDRRLHPKTVVAGARTNQSAVAFIKDDVRQAKIQHLEVNGTHFTAVHDPALDVVRIYLNPDERDFIFRDGTYHAGGSSWQADSLPLTALNSFDAMWFAWAAFYPQTALADGEL